MINIPSYKKDPNYRYKMPALQIKVEGKGNGVRTKFLNLFEVSRCLGVPPEYPLRYFGAEFGAIIEFKQSEQKAMLNGGVRREDLQSSLDHFIETFVLCPKCKYPEICMRIKKNELYSDCKACGEVRKMNMTHKIVNFILKSPPTGSTKALSNKKHETGPKGKTGKKKKQSLSLKSAEIQECLERLAEETDITRAGEVLTNLGASRDYDTDIRAYLLFKGIIGSNLNVLMKNNDLPTVILLKQASSSCIEDFFMAFVMVYGLDELWKEKINTSLYLFYNNDMISEEFIDAWRNNEIDFNESSPVYSEVALEDVKKHSAEFFKWLATAEEEENEEESENEEVKKGNGEREEGKEKENEEDKEGNGEREEGKEKKNELMEEEKEVNGESVYRNAEEGKDLMSRLRDVEDVDIDDI